MSILCYDGNRQTKSKLEDENQKNMYVSQVYMMKNKQTRKQKSYIITVV